MNKSHKASLRPKSASANLLSATIKKRLARRAELGMIQKTVAPEINAEKKIEIRMNSTLTKYSTQQINTKDYRAQQTIDHRLKDANRQVSFHNVKIMNEVQPRRLILTKTIKPD